MVLVKGRIVYVPSILVNEVDDIRREENIIKKSIAMRKLVEHARVGREVQRLIRLDWTKKNIDMPNIWTTYKKSKKRLF